MTPTQFRAILDRLGLKQTGADGVAKLFGYGDRAPRRWAAGDPIPPLVAAVLRLMAAGKITASQVDAARRGKSVE